MEELPPQNDLSCVDDNSGHCVVQEPCVRLGPAPSKEQKQGILEGQARATAEGTSLAPIVL